MSQLSQLKAKLTTLDQIIAEAKAERRRAEEVLATWEDRQARRSARQRSQLDDLARRMPALRSE